MDEPNWAHVKYEKPDFQNISYYSAPKKKKELKSLDEVDPELLKTMEKLGISIEEQKKLSEQKTAEEKIVNEETKIKAKEKSPKQVDDKSQEKNQSSSSKKQEKD